MRHSRSIFAGCCLLALSACGGGSEHAAYEEVATLDVEEAAADAAAPVPSDRPGSAIATEGTQASERAGETAPAAPQIAYVYGYGFRIAGDRIAELAQAHVDLCEARNEDCRVISLNQSGSEGDYGYGRLELAVAADVARDFGKDLADAAEGMGGERVDVSISGEDLSKQIVDTEARLRARTLLRDRLMEVLRTRKGSVQELVEAERGVAQVNEEIDQARSWLAEMRGRVAFSRVSVTYNSSDRSGGSFSRPIASAFQSMGAVMGSVIAALIYLIAGAIPVVALLALLVWLWRKSGVTLFRKRQMPAPSGDPAKTEE